jgi:CheY-like chemotaxis protein
VIYTGRELTAAEEARLEETAETTIVKDLRSLDHLLEKTTLFLHRVDSHLRPAAREVIQQVHKEDGVLAGKKVLIVDDDVRNIFAMTSKLERWKMDVIRAENGREAIAILEKSPGIDLILMDIMMPEMDGYETMRAIRGMGHSKDLPIIALTAKAMRGDRQKCIDAGASDYLAKPVGSEQLFSMLRVWINRHEDRVQGHREAGGGEG